MPICIFRFPALLISLLAFATAGCGEDVEGKRKIDERVRTGQYKEAVRLAHKYFEADKLLLLTNLEYIADKREKALKHNYRKSLLIHDWSWERQDRNLIRVAGKLVNMGNMAITGFSIRIKCMRHGQAACRVTIAVKGEVGPGMVGRFAGTGRCPEDYDDVSIEVLDFGLKE